MDWIKYADKKPDVGDIVVSKESALYCVGKIKESNHDIPYLYIDDGYCGYIFNNNSEYIILEKSTPAKVVKERPHLTIYDLVVYGNDRKGVVGYRDLTSGEINIIDTVRGEHVEIERSDITRHYRNGELIWSREE